MLEAPYIINIANPVCKDFDWAPDSKNKMLLPL